jgi:hypothetical protein
MNFLFASWYNLIVNNQFKLDHEKGIIKMSKKILTLKLLEYTFCVMRLDKDAIIPEWINKDYFYSITRTDDEFSIVCLQDSVPLDIKGEKDWKILKIMGILDFSLIGILASISTLLAENKISIFVISTFDTDYILVKNDKIEAAVSILAANNYEILI